MFASRALVVEAHRKRDISIPLCSLVWHNGHHSCCQDLLVFDHIGDRLNRRRWYGVLAQQREQIFGRAGSCASLNERVEYFARLDSPRIRRETLVSWKVRQIQRQAESPED